MTPRLLFLAFALAACGSSSDGTDTGDDDLTVRPTGTASPSSEVVLDLPAGFQTSFVVGPYAYVYSFAFSQLTRAGGGMVIPLEPGQPRSVLPSSADRDSCLQITLLRRKSPSDPNPTASKQLLCDATFTAGQRTSIALGAAKLWWTGYPNVWMGPTDMVVLHDDGPRVTDAKGAAWYFDVRYPAEPRYLYETLNDVPLLFAPGTYTHAINKTTLGSKTFEVKALQQIDASFGNDDRLATVKITHEAGGEFGTWNMVRSMSCGGETVTYDPGTQNATLTTRVVTATDTTSCVLTSSTGMRNNKSVSMPFTLAVGQEVDVQFKRLDIDDAHISDGTTQRATVNVRRRYENGGWSEWLFDRPLDSKIGMLLPPGHYQVHAQWPDGQQDNEVDL